MDVAQFDLHFRAWNQEPRFVKRHLWEGMQAGLGGVVVASYLDDAI
jgi:hypothetical protein